MRAPWFLAAIATFTAGCEAQTTVVTSMSLPADIAKADRTPKRLHVALRKASSFSEKLSLPDGQCPEFDNGNVQSGLQLVATDGGYELTQSAIPSVPEFCVAAWYDTNDSGKIDPGDAVGTVAKPYPSQPSTFFGSNRYKSRELVLQTIR